MLVFSLRPITAVALLATFALSACGSPSATSTVVDTGGTLADSDIAVAPTSDEASAFLALVAADEARVNGIPGTAFDPLEATTTGTANYVGPGSVNIIDRQTTDTDVLTMVGTATVAVDFETVTFDGEVVDLFAVTPTGETDLVTGSITIADGVQTNVEGRPTLLGGTASGSLEAFDTTYAIDVDLEGLLRGTNTSFPGGIPVRAISLEGEAAVGDGTLVSEVVIVGDRDANNEGGFVNR